MRASTIECPSCCDRPGIVTLGEHPEDCGDCATYVQETAAAGAAERARIVAWLFGAGQQYADGDMVEQCEFTAEAYEAAAMSIERGEHEEKTR